MASINIYRDANGVIKSCRWRAYLGLDERGKAKYTTKTVKNTDPTKSEAKLRKEWQLAADAWEKALRDGAESTNNDTFQAFVSGDFWEIHVKGGNLKPSSVAFYTNMRPRCVEYLGSKKLTAIKQTDCERFLIWLRDQKQKNGQPLSAGTQKHYFNFLRIVFSFAEEKGYIVKSPMRGVKPPKQPHKDVDYLAPADAQAFIKALQTAPLRWRAIMQIMIYLGLRRGEVCGLQWQDIDFSANTVRVQRNVSYTAASGVVVGEPKTANSFRTLPAPAAVMVTLRAWKVEQAEFFRNLADTASTTIVITPTAFVFSADLDPYSPQFPTHLTKKVKQFCRAHCLPDMSPHDLRHTCGSLMLEAGVNLKAVQQFLGHEDAETTLKFYAGVVAESLRKAGDSLANALSAHA